MKEIVSLIRNRRFDEAMEKLAPLQAGLKDEEEAGYFYCLVGEIYSASKQRERLSQLSKEKIEKILSIISEDFFSDEFDRGFSKCIRELMSS